MIVMIDNYDSFTYNLVQDLQNLGTSVLVIRNDQANPEEVLSRKPEAIVISPGPGHPQDAGICVPLIRTAPPTLPILGVCLGHQAIALAFGGTIGPAARLMHGKTSNITSDGRSIYQGLPIPFKAMRYHSLAVVRDAVPPCLSVTATADDGEIMGLRHRDRPVEGIQFHPESIMTPVGKRLLRNFLRRTRTFSQAQDSLRSPAESSCQPDTQNGA